MSTEQNAKHTPGPWEVFDGPNVNGTSHVLIGTDDVWIARMQFGPGESDLSNRELYANARLIAAAPDLLDMLNDALGTMYDLLHEPRDAAEEIERTARRRYEAVIAKAEGR